MHYTCVVIGHIVVVYSSRAVPLEVILGTSDNILGQNPYIAVSIWSGLFMLETNGMADFVYYHTFLKGKHCLK